MPSSWCFSCLWNAEKTKRICTVGWQEEGVSGEGVDAVTQAPSPVLHPIGVPGNKTLNLPQILDSIYGRAKVTSEQGQRETPWPQFFLLTWVFHALMYTALLVMLLPSDISSFHRKNQPQVICMMNSPSALISAACRQLYWCALNL